jgi:hypothetical protein
MAAKPKTQRQKASKAAPFLALLDQMEQLIGIAELEWPDEVRMDASRRLSRLARAVRHAAETSQRL